MGNAPLVEYNVEGRKERASLGAASYLFNLIGIIGNILVLHVFRKRINVSSNYRIFVMFLSVVDLFPCIVLFVKEYHRMSLVYNQNLNKIRGKRISKLEDMVEEYFPDIVAVNGILNPFVYLFTDNGFKQDLMKMCGRKT
ncbi:uncharacterized protein LOC130051530 [Ostrea edulis]|uniref:uncharacterized protein LOC130051530 n=1 Tax=Ostrea edulis TaxID=37623 RepID=UPI0024AF49CB|nr:uncharacterized protein LOC130051530 [Ostrea edulis]